MGSWAARCGEQCGPERTRGATNGAPRGRALPRPRSRRRRPRRRSRRPRWPRRRGPRPQPRSRARTRSRSRSRPCPRRRCHRRRRSQRLRARTTRARSPLQEPWPGHKIKFKKVTTAMPMLKGVTQSGRGATWVVFQAASKRTAWKRRTASRLTWSRRSPKEVEAGSRSNTHSIASPTTVWTPWCKAGGPGMSVQKRLANLRRWGAHHL